MSNNFLFEKDGPLTTITFNRPEKRNCLDQEIILEFESLLQRVRDDRETRGLIVTGAGNAFCSGADTSQFKDVADPVKRPRPLASNRQAAAASDRARVRRPRAFGRGDYRCDQRLRSGRRLVVRPRVRFLPGGRGRRILGSRGRYGGSISRRAGESPRRSSWPWRAKEAILMCRHYSAAELLAMGVINRIVKPEELIPAARELAHSMAAKSADAIANSKRDINAVFFGPRLF